jgi:hypothetical protein
MQVSTFAIQSYEKSHLLITFSIKFMIAMQNKIPSDKITTEGDE